MVAASVCGLSVPSDLETGEIGAKFRHLCRKSESESKNMMLDFAPELSTRKIPKLQIAENGVSITKHHYWYAQKVCETTPSLC